MKGIDPWEFSKVHLCIHVVVLNQEAQTPIWRTYNET